MILRVYSLYYTDLSLSSEMGGVNNFGIPVKHVSSTKNLPLSCSVPSIAITTPILLLLLSLMLSTIKCLY